MRMAWGLWLVAACGVLMSLTVAQGQTTWYVTTNGNDGAAGTDWSTALLTPSNAVSRAASGDTILVSNGTYTLTAKLVVTNAVSLQGVNGASNTSLRVSGALEILHLSNTVAVVDGFRLTGSSGLDWTYYGAVKVQAGTLRNCVVDGNSLGGGGGVYLVGGLVTGCTISNNTAHWGYNGQGGGVHMTGGALSNCWVIGNRANGDGGGVWMTGGLVTRCVITNNTQGDIYTPGGAGVYMSGGTLVNSLVARNRITTTPSIRGGGVCLAGGSIVHCTIADNSVASGYDGAGLYMTAGTVSNSIVYYNSSLYPAEGRENVYATGGSIVYSCTQPPTNAVGNISLLPDFIDRAGGDYRLRFGSVCIDAATNVAWITTDLDGTARSKDGDGEGTARPDMGCYEADTPATFQCGFSGTPLTGLFSMQAVFTAQVIGPGTNSVTYAWDFNNDGNDDLVGTGYAVVTNTYGVGIHSVRLTCVNSLSQTATVTRTEYFTVYSDTAYVATNGAHVAPYDTWAKAATNIQTALNAVYTPGLVVVSNGTYTLGEPLVVSRPVTLVATNGASNTTLRVSGALEILYLTHTSAVVDGFRLTGSSGLNYSYHGAVKVQAGTLRNCVVAGNSMGGGGGVYLIGGLVTGCTITNNSATWAWDAFGAGVYVTGGVLSNSVVTRNTSTGYGAGIYLTGGLVTRCIITNNVVSPEGSNCGGAGLRMTGGTMVNSLVSRNLIGQRSGITSTNGSGVWMSGGSIINCTIAGNTNAAGDIGSGIYMTAGGLTNSIVYFNGASNPAVTNQNIRMTGGSVSYCNTDPAIGGLNNLNADPRFMSTNLFNYQLHQLSPCINVALSLPGVVGGLDLAGNARVQYGGLDMGAYEAPPAVAGILMQVN